MRHQPIVNDSIQSANKPLIIPTATTTEVSISTIDTSGWKTYRNEELGIELQYPREWQVSEEKLYGLRGEKIIVLFKNDNRFIEIGAISPDFQVDRGGHFTDSQGYSTDSQGNYFFNFVDDKKVLVKTIKTIDTPLGKVVILDNQQFDYLAPNPGPGLNNTGAFVNLTNSKFPGVAIRKFGNFGISDEIFFKLLQTLGPLK